MVEMTTATAKKSVISSPDGGEEVCTATPMEAIAECVAIRGHVRRSAPPVPRLLAVRGPSGSGKTTLIEALIPALAKRGVRVGTIKHAHHGATLDVPGKDSHRHASAGAACVLLLGPGQAGFFVPRDAEPDPGSWLPYFTGRVDLILVEGFSQTPAPCITLETAEDGPPRIEISDGRAEASNGQPETRWTVRIPRVEAGVALLPAPLVERLAGEVTARLSCL